MRRGTKSIDILLSVKPGDQDKNAGVAFLITSRACGSPCKTILKD